MAETAQVPLSSLCKTGTSKEGIRPQVSSAPGHVIYSRYFTLRYLTINWRNTPEVHQGKCEHSLFSGYSLLYPRDQPP